MKSLQVPVRMGSNIKYICIKRNQEIFAEDLIRKTIKKLKLQDNVENYVLFERSLGIDRMLDSNENITQLWLKWLQEAQKSESDIVKCEFIVKKFKKTKLMLLTKQNSSSRARKLYEIGRRKFLEAFIQAHRVPTNNQKLDDINDVDNSQRLD